MLTDAWQIPPGSLLLSVVYPLAQIHCASLLPLSLPSVWFCFLQPYMDPWHGQANAASCRTLREAAPFLSFMPFLLWFSLLSFFSWKTFPQITCTWNLILGSATGEYRLNLIYSPNIWKKNTKHEKRSSPFAWKQYHRQVKTNWKNTFGTCDKTLISLIYKSSWKWKVTQSCATLCDPMD